MCMVLYIQDNECLERMWCLDVYCTSMWRCVCVHVGIHVCSVHASNGVYVCAVLSRKIKNYQEELLVAMRPFKVVLH